MNVSQSRAINVAATALDVETSINARTTLGALVALALSGATAAQAMRELLMRGADGAHAFAGALTSRLLQDIADGSQGRADALAKAKRDAKKAGASKAELRAMSKDAGRSNSGSTSLYVQFTRIAAEMESPLTIARRGGSKNPEYVVVDRVAGAKEQDAAPEMSDKDFRTRTLRALGDSFTSKGAAVEWIEANADSLRAMLAAAAAAVPVSVPAKRAPKRNPSGSVVQLAA